MISTRVIALCLVGLALSCTTGCGSEPAEATPGPFAELQELGLDRYVGLDDAAQEAQEASITSWTWPADPAGDSPACMDGGPYRVQTRTSEDPVGKDNLVVFLQGGGACWSNFCLAFTRAGKRIPNLDTLRSDNPANPVRSWNLVYLPYCDGSLFVGDARHDDDGDGQIDRDHRGLRNLSAALTVARAQFPKPKRVLLAGSSGGGYGTILAMPLARVVWPDAEILVMNDSGVGVGKPGNTAFMLQLLTEFGALKLLPPSCADCTRDGHLTEFISWGMERDPDVRVAAFSATRDFVIASLFLQIESADFDKALRAEMKTLEQRFPGRFAAFLTEGTTHTTLLGDIAGFRTVVEEEGEPKQGEGGLDLSALGSFLGGLETTKTGDVVFADWLKAFVDGSESWKPVAP